ncbi:DUF1127 domain-containing protein [Minwuia sp.]|uniref:DUF1127 domain-containing protein n=1 Tax=Minwuia sp. TaxID=2493630 RepID=UPI003A936C35
MTYQTYDMHTGVAGGFFKRIGDWALNRIEAIASVRAAQQRLAELEALDNRTLKDIGLSRNELPSVAHNPHDLSRTAR